MPLKFGVKDGIIVGAAGGVLWGLVSMAVNSATGAFAPEAGLVHDAVSFTLGGGLFGVVAGAFIGAGARFIPFGEHLREVGIHLDPHLAAARAGGAMLSAIEPERYHVLTPRPSRGCCSPRFSAR